MREGNGVPTKESLRRTLLDTIHGFCLHARQAVYRRALVQVPLDLAVISQTFRLFQILLLWVYPSNLHYFNRTNMD